VIEQSAAIGREKINNYVFVFELTQRHEKGNGCTRPNTRQFKVPDQCRIEKVAANQAVTGHEHDCRHDQSTQNAAEPGDSIEYAGNHGVCFCRKLDLCAGT
jgi:pullulanase/glycogen debranching enzyme